MNSYSDISPKNISVVTLNSDKGVGLWNKMKATTSLLQEERDIEEAIKGGGSFRNCATRNPKRKNSYMTMKGLVGKSNKKKFMESILKARIQSIFKH